MNELEILEVDNISIVHKNLLLLADPSIDVIDTYISRSILFEARKNNRILGILALLPTRPNTIEIINIAISEDSQGKGFGKELIEFSIKYAKEKGFRYIDIGTGNSSINQLALYQKCGFRIMGIDKDYFVKNYSVPIIENGIPCVDMIRLSMNIL